MAPTALLSSRAKLPTPTATLRRPRSSARSFATCRFPPQAFLTAPETITGPGGVTKTFTVTYTDDVAVNISTLGNSNIIVSGPNGFSQPASLLSVDVAENGTPRTATYQITTPAGVWGALDNGTYSIALQPGEVADTSGNAAPAAILGAFVCDVQIPPQAFLTAPRDDHGPRRRNEDFHGHIHR